MSQFFPRTRRSILATVPVAAAGTAAAGLIAARPGMQGSVRLTADHTRRTLARTTDGSGVLDMPLDPELEEVTHGWRTSVVPTSGFNMVGVTWKSGGKRPRIRVRISRDGSWDDWKVLPHESDVADAEEHAGREGSSLIWVGRAHDIQIAFLGDKPEDARMMLLDTVVTEADRKIPDHGPDDDDELERKAGKGSRPKKAPWPKMYFRRDWGADDSLNNGFAGYCWTVKQVHIHHSAGSNDYTKADVPGILRGIHRYHTQSLGWSDIAYNYLIDKFGRAWVGRKTGSNLKAVKGAHTLGFNHMSVGICVIGNYQNTEPIDAVFTKICNIAAWKLDMYDRNPAGKVWVKTTGSDRYAAGRVLHMPVMNGHRDTNETTCPGWHVYRRMDRIRYRTHLRTKRFS